MKCPYCSQPVEEADLTCRRCGRRQEGRDAVPGGQQTVVVEFPKSRFIYIILALFFGWLGLHNFYAGYIIRGLIQFLFGAFWFFVFPPVLLVYVPWLILEILLVRRDARKIRMG